MDENIKDMIKSLRDNIEQYRQSYIDSYQQLEESTKSVDADSEELSSLNEEIEEINQNIEKIEKEIAEEKSKIDKIQQTILNLSDNADPYAEENLNNEVDSINKRIASKRDELDSLEGKKYKLENQKYKILNKENKLDKEKKEIIGKIAEERNKHIDIIDEIEKQFEKKRDELNKNIEEINAALEKITGDDVTISMLKNRVKQLETERDLLQNVVLNGIFSTYAASFKNIQSKDNDLVEASFEEIDDILKALDSIDYENIEDAINKLRKVDETIDSKYDKVSITTKDSNYRYTYKTANGSGRVSSNQLGDIKGDIIFHHFGNNPTAEELKSIENLIVRFDIDGKKENVKFKDIESYLEKNIGKDDKKVEEAKETSELPKTEENDEEELLDSIINEVGETTEETPENIQDENDGVEQLDEEQEELKSSDIVKQEIFKRRVIAQRKVGTKVFKGGLLGAAVVSFMAGTPELGFGLLAFDSGISATTTHIGIIKKKAIDFKLGGIAKKFGIVYDGYKFKTKQYRELSLKELKEIKGKHGKYKGMSLQEALDEVFDNKERLGDTSNLKDKDRDFNTQGFYIGMKALDKVTVDNIEAAYEELGGIYSDISNYYNSEKQLKKIDNEEYEKLVNGENTEQKDKEPETIEEKGNEEKTEVLEEKTNDIPVREESNGTQAIENSVEELIEPDSVANTSAEELIEPDSVANTPVEEMIEPAPAIDFSEDVSNENDSVEEVQADTLISPSETDASVDTTGYDVDSDETEQSTLRNMRDKLSNIITFSSRVKKTRDSLTLIIDDNEVDDFHKEEAIKLLKELNSPDLSEEDLRHINGRLRYIKYELGKSAETNSSNGLHI